MAKRKAKDQTPFVIHDDTGERFVELAAVMHPLCAFADGLSITTFKGEKTLYLQIDVAIDWVEKEMQHHSREKYETMLAVLKKFKAQPDVPRTNGGA